MRAHELATWPEEYEATRKGEKTFEYRRNDRGFEVGDILYLKEYHPQSETYTGRDIHAMVRYILHGGNLGVPDDFCVMSIEVEA